MSAGHHPVELSPYFQNQHLWNQKWIKFNHLFEYIVQKILKRNYFKSVLKFTSMKFTLHQDDHKYVQVISLKYVHIALLLHKWLFLCSKKMAMNHLPSSWKHTTKLINRKWTKNIKNIIWIVSTKIRPQYSLQFKSNYSIN